MSEIIIPPKKVIQTINTIIPGIITYGQTFIDNLLNTKNTIFNFLLPEDPFYPFFQQTLEKETNNINKPTQITQNNNKIETITQIKPTPIILPPSFSYKVPPDIGGLQLDTIHLTAQYTAIYGQSFIQEIFEKEEDTPLFNFLKPSKPYFSFFSNLVEQYRLSLDPSPQLKRRLEQESDSILTVYNNLQGEFENYNLQLEKKKKEEEELLKNNNNNENEEWDDFIIVQTIEYDDENNFIEPSIFKEEEKINKSNKKQSKIFQISPITKQKVLIDEFSKHLKYETLHPQYEKEQILLKNRKLEANNSLANGNNIYENLKNFAQGKSEPLNSQIPIWDGLEESIPKIVTKTARILTEEPISKPELKINKLIIGPSPIIKK